MKQLVTTNIFFVLLALFTLWSPQAKAQVLQSAENPMGLIDEEILRCFTFMNPGTFTASYKFKTTDNSTTERTYGFSIPLVGDLNGDGHVEVVALGAQNTAAGGLDAIASFLYIYNGETGKKITQYTLPSTFYPLYGGYHGSPSNIALVDADRNGLAEIILAYGYTTTGGTNAAKYRRRLVSYEVDKNLGLTEKWISDVPYDQNNNNVNYDPYNVTRPVPQIVDIDGDGEAEVIVYNKVYSAKNGKLKITLEDLGPLATYINQTNTISTFAPYAYTGRNRYQGGGVYDRDINFSAVYDLDHDGKFEIIAGGKVYYDLNVQAGTYKVKSAQSIGIGDGITSVADINGDGKAEIIVSGHTTSGSAVQVQVWDPGLLIADGTGWKKPANQATNASTLLAQRNFTYTYGGTGSMSYIYTGDIDGKTQNGKKHPEISILGGRFYAGMAVPVHPNVSAQLGPNNGLNAQGYVPYTTTAPAAEGSIISFTWDETASAAADRLKVSFIMEHDDSSVNTGFTLFDFDNDGIQDICYRDEHTLRVLSPVKPYVKLRDLSAEKFSTPVASYTGFEYPVVADIDGDGSADMVVMASTLAGDDKGYVYAVEAKQGTTKFAPAPRVWNQFMYHPLKINEDLTTPLTNIHPLSDKLAFVKYEDIESGYKTHIYNNTVTQVVKSAVFGIPNSKGDTVYVLRPVVPTPDAQILHGKVDYAGSKLKFYIKNIGDATLSKETPIRLFKETDIPSGLTFSLKLGVDLLKGDSVLIEQALTAAQIGNNYTVRVTDHSTIGEDLFMQDVNYVDCNWADNVEQLGDFLLKNDAATVVQYTSQLIDVFGNDILPELCGAVLKNSDITTPGGIGVMEGSFGKFEIVNNKLQYTAPAAYPGNVVKVTYSATCSSLTKTANLYIFVLENCALSWGGCVNSYYQFCLRKPIADMTFSWYDVNKTFIGTTGPVVSSLTTAVSYYAAPKFDLPTSDYAMIDFPMAKVTATPLSAGGLTTVAKWNGSVDTDWHNPLNWVEVKAGGTEIPITWVPISCVDVVLAKNAPNYPILTAAKWGECRHIKFEDRAMIAGINNLTYTTAEMETLFTKAERERFVMWSAPFKDTYTGDYHFAEASGNPAWGKVYMNFFQSANPDYATSIAQEKTFTSTFGSVGTKLPLGKAFNVKVISDKTSAFKFPNKATAYTDANGQTVSGLTRTQSGRFITDGVMNNLTGALNLPVDGNNSYRLIQVVNPFMAYLKVGEFLSANSGVIESAYKIWNGNVKSNFLTILSHGTSLDQRYLLDDNNTGFINASEGLIAPLQSFFVMKRSPNTSVTTLTMNASMTTTINPNALKYELKSVDTKALEAEKLLYISATQGNEQNTTVIQNVPKASIYYDGNEDSYKLFNDEAAVAVYTITKQKEPLAINTTGDFTENIKLGIRMKSADAPVRLDFSGASTFGHNAYLVDNVKNKVIDLVQDPTYTFTPEKSTTGLIELNDRFSLQFRGTTTGLSDVLEEQWTVVSTGRDLLEVRSFTGEISHLQIINLFGQLVYADYSPSLTYQISLPGKQVYLVKVVIGGESKVGKVIVK